MENGQVAERGTHTELLAQQGIYAGLWNAQQDEGVLETEEEKTSEDARAKSGAESHEVRLHVQNHH